MTRPPLTPRTVAVLAALSCAACSSIYVPSEPSHPAAPLPPAASTGRPTPIPTREIDLAGNCHRTEEDGYREEATVKVSHNNVQSLDWKLWVARRGTCEFHLSDFRQVRQSPHIELAATDGSACRLMVWQDPRRVTIATANCEKRCTGGVYTKAWPVLFDPASGDCAQVR